MSGAPSKQPPMPSSLRAVTRALSLALAAAVGLAVAPAASFAGSPSSDPFYAAPADLADLAPGAAIRSRKVALQPIVGLKLPLTTYQVLYRTNDTLGRPVATAATIILPPYRPKTNRRLVSLQIAYDGLSSRCQPSYSLRTGTNAEASGEFTIFLNALMRGWTVVTSDYEGPNNTWIAGAMAGHGVLDGIRAAEAFGPAGLDGSKTAVGLSGYSGGGHATAWANELAQTYAPELKIVGAAQGGVPANPTDLMHSLDGSKYAGVMFAAIVGLRNAYPDSPLDQYITPKGQALFKRLQTQCITDFALSNSGQHIADYSTVSDILAVPAIKQIADDNTLGQHMPTIPTFMYHATDDTLVGFKGANTLRDQYCAAGVPLYWKTTTGDHIGPPVKFGSRPLDFLAQRFDGRTFTSNCPPPTAIG